MGIFSQIELETTQSDSPFSPDTLHPLSTAPCGASSPAESAAMLDAFEDDGRTGDPDGGCETSGVDTSEDFPEKKESTDEKGTAEPEPDDAAAAERERAEAEKRRAHEEAEAKRKAEFEAKQAAKKAAEQEQLARLSAMSDEEVMMASMRRVAEDTEKLTRRNMKECVSELIQTKCLDDPAFARRAMHPKKSMIHCIWYINRKAREYLQKEMKNNAEEPVINGIYGGDVPDDLCYQWAEEYFNDPDAEEDREKEEKFVPQPYAGGPAMRDKRKKQAKKTVSNPQKAVKPAPPKSEDDQISMGGFDFLEKAG